ncbi:hypothetical protein EVAR_23177_1 [Eumeta japonica]|uniref:Uncharacterized protein n=1 Tax=Eumeta variegata TaxID=151549 RepID=A0A4C2AEL7_EUMVA|nr:hypothetical protein EVAR_23177_1 [Eumeta japonica]
MCGVTKGRSLPAPSYYCWLLNKSSVSRRMFLLNRNCGLVAESELKANQGIESKAGPGPKLRAELGSKKSVKIIEGIGIESLSGIDIGMYWYKDEGTQSIFILEEFIDEGHSLYEQVTHKKGQKNVYQAN